MKSKQVWGRIFAGLGILVVLTEIVLHVMTVIGGRTYELNHTVLLAGATIGFVGFYLISPTQTKEGIKVIQDFVPRFGRRKTDAVAVPEAETIIKAEPTTPSEGPVG